jgi:predicted negative regulator of RcsB-dependent stress response
MTDPYTTTLIVALSVTVLLVVVGVFGWLVFNT